MEGPRPRHPARHAATWRHRGHALLLLVPLLLVGCLAPAVEPNETLMLTWADDPTTTMVVQWLDDGRYEDVMAKAVPMVVRYAPHDSDGWQRAATALAPFGNSPYHLRRAQLTGLHPGTPYKLKLRQDAEPVYFRTAPATLDEPVTFAEGGDIGTADIVAKLHEQAASWNPLFALVGGDLAYADAWNEVAWVRFLRTWRAHMVTDDNRLIPLVATIGNHEVWGGFSDDRADAPFFYALFGALYDEQNHTALEFGDYLALILLDTGHTTPIAGAQTDWLRRTLFAYSLRPPAHLFVAYHVPAYPSRRSFSGRGRTDIRQHWAPLMQRFGVDVVFEHDDHTYKRTHPLRDGRRDPAGLVYLGDGAWGRGPRRPAARPYLARSAARLHVIRVRLDAQQRTFTAVDAQGRVIDRYVEPVRD